MLKRDAGGDMRQVARLAAERLRDSNYFELRNLDCEYDDDRYVLILRGRVSSYYMKQIAQSLVAGIDEVHRVHHLLVVEDGNCNCVSKMNR